jgi:hydrogenase 3 maturation protease
VIPSVITEISAQLKDASKIVVLGIGSKLRCDDAAGVLVGKALLEQKAKTPLPNLEVIEGNTAPENFTGVIRRLAPSHLVLVDSADMREPPGTIKLIKKEEMDGYSFSTHALPIKVMIDYLLQSLRFKLLIIGIQPKILGFGDTVSDEVRKAAGEVVRAILTT